MFRISTLRALVLATAMSAAAFSQTAAFAPLAGETSVALSSELLGALTSLQVTPAAVGVGRLAGSTATFPITAGAADVQTARAEIMHAGGLSLTAGSTTVRLLNFTIETLPRPVLTGVVIVGDTFLGRVPLFNIQLPSITLPLAPRAGVLFELAGARLSLSEQAATALNQVFNVRAFAAGIPIGTASISGVVR